MMYAVMGRRQNDFIQKPEPSVFDQVFAHVYKTTPESVNEHNDQQHGGIHAQENADGCPDKIGVRCF